MTVASLLLRGARRARSGLTGLGCWSDAFRLHPHFVPAGPRDVESLKTHHIFAPFPRQPRMWHGLRHGGRKYPPKPEDRRPLLSLDGIQGMPQDFGRVKGLAVGAIVNLVSAAVSGVKVRSAEA